MSSLLCPQRHALEKAVGAREIDLRENMRFFLKKGDEEKEIFFLGVSDGVGTCADVKNLSFAVFSLNYRPSGRRSSAFFAALVRLPSEEEKELVSKRVPAVSKIIAEGLEIEKEEFSKIFFRSNGKIIPYAFIF